MARARVVRAWWFEARGGWAVEIDGLEGTVTSGQVALFTLGDEVAGPYAIRSVDVSDHLRDRTSDVALMVQCARKRGLDRFVGGTVGTADPL